MTPPQPPTVSLARAVELCGVSRSTIQRRKTELIELGATVKPSGWVIPIPALIGAGLLSPTTPPDPIADTPSDTSKDTPSDTSEIERLRERLRDAETRAEVAEAIADERGKALDRADIALRMLEAGKPAEKQQEQKPRRRWWQRSEI